MKVHLGYFDHVDRGAKAVHAQGMRPAATDTMHSALTLATRYAIFAASAATIVAAALMTPG